MSTREAVIVVQEVYDFVRFLKIKAANGRQASPGERKLPDFQAHKKAIFGDRILPDSQEILDELRADRI